MSARNDNARAWRQGVQLAIEMIEACDDSDEMVLNSDCRNGRPQRNVVAGYLTTLCQLGDPRVTAAFGAVLTDYIASGEDGGVPDLAFLERLARQPVATEVQS